MNKLSRNNKHKFNKSKFIAASIQSDACTEYFSLTSFIHLIHVLPTATLPVFIWQNPTNPSSHDPKTGAHDPRTILQESLTSGRIREDIHVIVIRQNSSL